MFPWLLLAVAFVPMAFEARLAAAHDRALRAAGAREPLHDVFPLMQVAYPAAFLAMAFEAWRRGADANAVFIAGLIVFALAKSIKYWAIATLGRRWSFRVLVLPGSPLIATGPYRFMRHPNYLGVIGEIGGMAVMAQAPIAGITSLLVFAALIAMRIRVEERALDRSDSP
jgi:methyltransferase